MVYPASLQTLAVCSYFLVFSLLPCTFLLFFFFCYKTKGKEDDTQSSSVPSARKTYGLIL